MWFSQFLNFSNIWSKGIPSISNDPFKPQSNKVILALTQQQKKPQQDDDKEVRKNLLSLWHIKNIIDFLRILELTTKRNYFKNKNICLSHFPNTQHKYCRHNIYLICLYTRCWNISSMDAQLNCIQCEEVLFRKEFCFVEKKNIIMFEG